MNGTLVDRALFLKRTHLFGDLDLDVLLPISDILEELLFQPAETVFSEGQEARAIYLILSGLVTIHLGDGSLCQLGPGELFGDESIFNTRPREYKAVASEPTRLLSLSYSNLLTVLSECPSVALNLIEEYAASVQFRRRICS
jgi:CRP/FNR family transcriptional regulator, cyclic AMP receptor protein